MSRGIGKTQQAILDALNAAERGALTIAVLAQQTGASPRQVRTAVHSLEGRGLVVTSTEHIGTRGRGEYGPLGTRRWTSDDELPTAVTITEGEPWPYREGYVATRDVELIHIGMPVMGLIVWLPEARIGYLDAMLHREILPAIATMVASKPEEMITEYERLTGTDWSPRPL